VANRCVKSGIPLMGIVAALASAPSLSEVQAVAGGRPSLSCQTKKFERLLLQQLIENR
jgi:hypothetical protein